MALTSNSDDCGHIRVEGCVFDKNGYFYLSNLLVGYQNPFNMNKIFLTFCLLFSYSIYGQDLMVIHRQIAVTDVSVDSWSATLNDDMSFYEQTFEDFTKREFGSKSQDDGKNEELLKKVSIPQVTDKRGDLRLTFFTEGSQTKMGVSFMLGYDVWINPEDYSEEMEKLRHLTRDYLRFHYTEYYNDIIEKDLKLISGHKKSIQKSEKSIGTMRSQISRNEEKLKNESNARRQTNMEKKNQQNALDIERLESEIPELQTTIDSLDEHILQMKEKLKYVEEQYYTD